MRVIIIHKTTPHWEAGARPTPELIARVGGLIGDLRQAGVFLAGEGLRPTSEGVRVTFSPGARQVASGPFERGNELPAAFSIVRAVSIDDAIDWAAEHGDAADVDIRPVTEAWDIGFGDRPAGLTTRRYMVLRKATVESEAGRTPARPAVPPPSGYASSHAAASPPVEHLVTETMRPSARGRRYRNTDGGVAMRDGPFTESKELIGGYVVIEARSLEEADAWVRRYIAIVETDEVDLRELE